MVSKKFDPLKIFSVVFCILFMFFILFPIVWMIPAAFKPKSEVFALPAHWWPQNFTFENFEKVFVRDTQVDFFSSMIMTTIVSVSSTFLSLLVNTMAAYSFARIEMPFKKILWPLYLIPMFVPGISISLTRFSVVSALGMLDTIWVLIVPGLAGAYQAFFFRQFFLGVPASYEEAAELDGCNKLQIYYKIFLPMSVTPIIIQGVAIFMAHWNSFLWPTLTINDAIELKQTMQVVKYLAKNNSTGYGVTMAATLIAMIPPLIVFAVLQKKILQGVTLSGIK